ncbi:MAG: hypothetical protein BECKG1743D_GA0114223_100893 [Candidatus Kentron sp. G]|nr:MAG: hypothetical protein BECKG1743F_GA0114225_100614 [Candidatus Kentron sp. G]VFM96457.1 MAG: hypothetical protein BECKG1743E_GA0114224_100624 [Candidatus Kentron sp. G]VFM98879.1 MAG: hypothetical protein BECKG1743D_GA0114223_100893 [Candidatus Kentron sp. G]
MKNLRVLAVLFLLPLLFSCSNDSSGERGGTSAQKGIGAEENDIFYRIDGAENEIFSITFAYLPRDPGDPLLLRVADLTVKGGGVKHAPTNIEAGTTLHQDTDYTQSFKRTDPKEDISIRLAFEDRPAMEIAVVASRPRDAVSVGTVVQSILPWEEYAEALEEDPAFDAQTNQWSPCDGRDIAGSGLANIWKKRERVTELVAPDLRGVFLRGLNQFVADEKDHGVKAVSKERKDPGEQKGAKLEVREEAGVLQGENVGAHGHKFQGGGGKGMGHAKRGRDIHYVWYGEGDVWQNSERSTKGNPEGEVRPKNVSMFYYIKIN